ncbi:hypothetical protein GCM10027444_26980 [Actinopolyspora lacussalsi]
MAPGRSFITSPMASSADPIFSSNQDPNPMTAPPYAGSGTFGSTFFAISNALAHSSLRLTPRLIDELSQQIRPLR